MGEMDGGTCAVYGKVGAGEGRTNPGLDSEENPYASLGQRVAVEPGGGRKAALNGRGSGGRRTDSGKGKREPARLDPRYRAATL